MTKLISCCPNFDETPSNSKQKLMLASCPKTQLINDGCTVLFFTVYGPEVRPTGAVLLYGLSVPLLLPSAGSSLWWQPFANPRPDLCIPPTKQPAQTTRQPSLLQYSRLQNAGTRYGPGVINAASVSLPWDPCSLGKCAEFFSFSAGVDLNIKPSCSLPSFSSLLSPLLLQGKFTMTFSFLSLATFYSPKRYFRKPKIQGPTLALEINGWY